jgi:hypothetical protein
MPVFRRLAAALTVSALAALAQSVPPVADWLPDGAVYVLHIDRPDALLDLAHSFKIPQSRIEPLAQNAAAVTYAVYPGDSAVWIFEAKDGLLLDTLQQSSKAAAKFYQEYPGSVAAWSLDGKQFFARTGNRLLLAGRADVIKALFTPHPQSSLSASPLYAEARRAAEQTASTAAWAFVNMAALNQYPPTQKALALGGEPIGVILSGAVKQTLRDARWLAASLCIDGGRLHLHAITDGKLTPQAAGAFTLPGAAGLLPNLTVPRELAAVTLWRDLGKFYEERDTLFPLKTSGGILAENFLEIFFTGRDLAQEVFGKFQPQVRTVVARQQYDPAIGAPEEQYPAAALVFRVKDPSQSADFGEVFEEAWQKAVGLTNFTRGQQALPGLLIDRETQAGVAFTFASFSPRGEKDRSHLPSRFNLRPSIVHTGPYIILSTTDGLARDLIDAVNKEDGRTPASQSSAHTFIDVTGSAGIAALLRVDKPAMVRQSVLEKGAKPDAAAREFDQNVAWLDRIARATLSIGASDADLEIQLK